MKSSVIFVVLLVAFVCSLTTRQQLKSPDMQGFIQKREMASYARKTHAEENIDAYNALRPHRQKWDNYDAQQKRDALAQIEGTVMKQNDVNPFAKPKPGAKKVKIQNDLNLGEAAFRIRRQVTDAQRPEAAEADANRAFQDLHGIVNQNLQNMNQAKPKSGWRKLGKYL